MCSLASRQDRRQWAAACSQILLLMRPSQGVEFGLTAPSYPRRSAALTEVRALCTSLFKSEWKT